MPETPDDAPAKPLKMTPLYTQFHAVVDHVEYVRRETSEGEVKWYRRRQTVGAVVLVHLRNSAQVRLERLYREQIDVPLRRRIDTDPVRSIAESSVRRMEEHWRWLDEQRYDLAELCAGCGWTDLANRLLRLPETAEVQV